MRSPNHTINAPDHAPASASEADPMSKHQSPSSTALLIPQAALLFPPDRALITLLAIFLPNNLIKEARLLLQRPSRRRRGWEFILNRISLLELLFTTQYRQPLLAPLFTLHTHPRHVIKRIDARKSRARVLTLG